jgi:hypothetical protein
MIDRRHLLGAATLGGAALASLYARGALSQTARSPASTGEVSMRDRLNAPGPEARFLAKRVGLWDVTETSWPAPGASPVVSTGLVAERLMIGSLLQEFLRAPNDTVHQAVKRTDLLCYNRLDGRWDYVAFDARDPAGLMPAWSLNRGELNRIEFSFPPLATVVGNTGELVRARQEMITKDSNHDVNDQYFTLADGTGTEWLGHRYSYVRRY